MNPQPNTALPDTARQATPPLVAVIAGPDGRESLQALLEAVPPASGLAFLVISPTDPPLLSDAQAPDALRIATLSARERVRIVADTVYLAPSAPLDFDQDGHVRPLPPAGERETAHAAELSLRRLAQARGPQAAAVLLGRSGCSGIHAVRWIREHGGLVVAAPELPCASTQRVDWVLPPAQVPQWLLRFFAAPRQGPGAPGLAPDAPPSDGGRDILGKVLDLVSDRTRCDFSHYQQEHLLRRIGRRMQVNHVRSLPEYLECLRSRPGECDALCDDLLVAATPFFRDPAGLQALSARIPALLRTRAPHEPLRAWVAGSATGEEAYSIAMLLSEHARQFDPAPLVQVFATDMSAAAVRTGREALYPPSTEADVAPARLRQFFTREERGWRVRRELREMVLFARHDVLQDPPFSRLDLVSCRDLLIHLDAEAKARLLRTFHFALQPNGMLLLGGMETLGEATALFDALDAPHGLYARRTGPRWPRGPLTTHRPPVRAREGASQAPPAAHGGSLLAPATAAQPSAAAPMRPSWSELHLRLVEQLAPPSLLVNAAHEIVHLSPGASRFLRPAGGEPERQLLALVAPALRIGLRSALLQAAQSRQPVSFVAALPGDAGQAMPLQVRVLPFTEGGDDFLLVLFQPARPSANDAAPIAEDGPVVHTLDRELDRLQHQLRETVEQYEASNEELRASNEELLAMNEELQVAAEELNASREELESAKAEVLAVHRELHDKLAALHRAHSNLDNLMAATDIPMVFLDRELRITRYTPAAMRVFKLLPADIGRPLLNMSTPLRYPLLEADAREVLERLAPLEREVQHEDGSRLLARIAPCRDDDEGVAGLVLCLMEGPGSG